MNQLNSVNKIINSITYKLSWKSKLRDRKIIDKWKRELLKQGALKAEIDLALSILNREEIDDNYFDINDHYYYDNVDYIEENRSKHYGKTNNFGCKHCLKQSKLADHIMEKENLISEELRQKLIKNVKKLEDIPNEQKDWHPGSDQVLDLVHPSLYCYVQGVSQFKDGSIDKSKVKEGSRYQWLPAECRIDRESNDGKICTKFLSYINNLYKSDHKELYQIIENIFAEYVPYFEEVLKRKLPEKCQVIVKLANIILTEKNPIYTGGSWHVEGMPYEHICASGIYYYENENIENSYLEFRRAINDDKIDYTQDDAMGVEWHYGIKNGDNLNEELGCVKTKQGRSLIFPNYLQHKVSSFHLKKGCKEGKRKILVFFLVDPDKRIISTADIPYQQREIQEKILIEIFNDRLPKDIIGVIAKYMSVMTLKKAKKYRERLMLFRKYFIDELNEQIYEREFSLCEH